ncbi:MAG: DUF6512 family protein [Butyribacter sp.]|nr:DUF6512 family protein [bacterium]MDY3855088.1 DUF6512 family protein [Butyribacter sp.]
MNKLKLYTIIGTAFVIIAGTISHFVYEWSGNNFILGFFFPINESTWEHMKLCFFPMLLYFLFTNQKRKDSYPCAVSSAPAGILLGTCLIPVIFYTYSGILGQNYIVPDIATFLLSVLFGFLAFYKLSLSCKAQRCLFWLWLGVIVFAICFVLFTYFPPKLGIFMEPNPSYAP